MSQFTPNDDRLVLMKDAIEHSKDHTLSSHKSSIDRLAPVCWPEPRVPFHIDGSKPLFAMGSCFARNIELRLKHMGVPLPRFYFPMSGDEWTGDIHDIINKFTPASIYNEVKWCYDIYIRGDGFKPSDTDILFYDIGDNMVVDSQLAGMMPISRERAIERRKVLYEYFSNIFEADAVILTLGLIECWWDTERKRFLEQAPYTRALLRKNSGNFQFYRLSYEDARNFVAQTIELINSVNHTKKVLLTTSPVPLARTFTEDDVIIANNYSKSMLRTVCGELTSTLENVAYMPSYETVSMTRDWFVYDPDKRHVSHRIVSQIISRAINNFFTNISEVAIQFVNSVALLEAGDIDAALKSAEEVVNADPDKSYYWEHMASCLEKKHKYSEAVKWRKKNYDLDPDHEMSTHMYIRTCTLAEQFEMGIRAGEAFLEKYPTSQRVGNILGTAYLRNQDFEKCETLAHQLIENNKIDHVAFFTLSRLNEAKGNLTDALKYAEHAFRVGWSNEAYKEQVDRLQNLVQESQDT